MGGMKIIFVSNYFNHHQKPVADVLFKLTDGEYRFIETSEISGERLKLGYPQYKTLYTLKYDDNPIYSQRLIDDAEVVIAGGGWDVCKRVWGRINRKKLTFEYSERLFKSPKNYLKIPVYAYHAWMAKGAYMLSASAFTASDYASFGMYKGKCYKWGYFPEVKFFDNIEDIFERKRKNRELKQLDVSILWVARLIELKHPESTIEVAKMLREEGVHYELNIIGKGPLERKMSDMINKNGLSSSVHLLGAVPPEKVRDYMEKSDIFLFTSDRNEGWGAVLNESMNSACAVVASNAIGAVPFLINNKRNGLIFRNQDWNDLYDKVHWLIKNPDFRCRIQEEAYRTITQDWNAENAARRLLKLIDKLNKGEDTPYTDGPCSADNSL